MKRRGTTAKSAVLELMTQSAYARHRGVSRQAIHRLIGKGRLPLTPSGLIDVRQAELTLAIRRPGGRPRKDLQKTG